MWRRFLASYGLLAGGIIGVGLFGLPATAARGGMVAFFSEGIVVLLIVVALDLLFADVVFGTSGRHRIPGYAELYLGKGGKTVAVLSNIFGILGALLAYIIAGGMFTWLLLGSVSAMTLLQATLIYFACGAFLVWRGVGKVAMAEVLLVLFFLLALLGLGWESRALFSWERLASLGHGEVFLPYGVLLFAFWGMSLIPDVCEQSGKRRGIARAVIIASIATAAVTYAVFVLIVAGVSGMRTSPEALEGLVGILSSRAVQLGLLFGLFTTFSSYLALGIVLMQTFQSDFKLSKGFSWSVTFLVPLSIFLLGVQQLLDVLSITGSLFLGVEGLLILFIVRAFWQRKRALTPVRFLLIGALSVALMLGVLVSLMDVLGSSPL